MNFEKIEVPSDLDKYAGKVVAYRQFKENELSTTFYGFISLRQIPWERGGNLSYGHRLSRVLRSEAVSPTNALDSIGLKRMPGFQCRFINRWEKNALTDVIASGDCKIESFSKEKALELLKDS